MSGTIGPAVQQTQTPADFGSILSLLKTMTLSRFDTSALSDTLSELKDLQQMVQDFDLTSILGEGSDNVFNKMLGDEFANSSIGGFLVGGLNESAASLLRGVETMARGALSEYTEALLSNVYIPDAVFLKMVSTLYDTIKPDLHYNNDYFKKLLLTHDLVLTLAWFDKETKKTYGLDASTLKDAQLATESSSVNVTIYLLAALDKDLKELNKMHTLDPDFRVEKGKIIEEYEFTQHKLVKSLIVNSYSNLDTAKLNSIVKAFNIFPSVFGDNDTRYSGKLKITLSDVNKMAPFYQAPSGSLDSRLDGKSILGNVQEVEEFIDPRNDNIKRLFIYLNSGRKFSDDKLKNKILQKRLGHAIVSTNKKLLDEATAAALSGGLGDVMDFAISAANRSLYEMSRRLEPYLQNPSKMKSIRFKDKTVIDPPKEKIPDSAELSGYYPYKNEKTRKFGIKNINRKLVVPCKYPRMGKEIVDGLVAVTDDRNMWGVINVKGKTIIPFNFTRVNWIKGGQISLVTITGTSVLYTYNNDLIEFKNLEHDVLEFGVNDGILISCRIDNGQPESWGVCDVEGNEVTTFTHSSIEDITPDGIIFTNSAGLCGFYNRKGDKVIAENYSKLIHKNGYLLYTNDMSNEGYGVMDIQGNIVLPPNTTYKFQDIDIKKHIMIVQNSDRNFGAYNFNGDEIITPYEGKRAILTTGRNLIYETMNGFYRVYDVVDRVLLTQVDDLQDIKAVVEKFQITEALTITIFNPNEDIDEDVYVTSSFDSPDKYIESSNDVIEKILKTCKTDSLNEYYSKNVHDYERHDYHDVTDATIGSTMKFDKVYQVKLEEAYRNHGKTSHLGSIYSVWRVLESEDEGFLIVVTKNSTGIEMDLKTATLVREIESFQDMDVFFRDVYIVSFESIGMCAGLADFPKTATYSFNSDKESKPVSYVDRNNLLSIILRLGLKTSSGQIIGVNNEGSSGIIDSNGTTVLPFEFDEINLKPDANNNMGGRKGDEWVSVNVDTCEVDHQPPTTGGGSLLNDPNSMESVNTINQQLVEDPSFIEIDINDPRAILDIEKELMRKARKKYVETLFIINTGGT